MAAAVTRRIEVETPFAVEFARSSRTRDGAPTLVPVSEGGAHVPAVLLVLDDSVTVADARAMLYRRETGRLNDTSAGSRAAWIAELAGFAGTSTCLYTALQRTSSRSPRRSWPNSRCAAPPPRPEPNGATASRICSSRKAAGSRRR